MNADKLRRQLEDHIGPITVDEVGIDAFSVRLPMNAVEHFGVHLSVERINDAWVVSDLGWLSDTVGPEDLVRFADMLECTGSPGMLEDGQFVARTDAESEVARLAVVIAHELASSELVRDALECRAGGAVVREQSPRVMAREARSDLVREFGERSNPLIRLDARVKGGGDVADANLVINAPRTTLPPKLVASCIDFTVTKSSVTQAKFRTSHLLRVVRQLEIPKWVLVRGDRVEAANELYGDSARIYHRDSPDGVDFRRDARRALAELGV